MKNALNFKAPFSCMVPRVNFINCFSSVYVHLEGIGEKMARKCGKKNCGACNYFQLFAAMAGDGFTRRHYGAEPSEMQKLIGNYGDYECGTDYTVDFLFGYAGYAYRKLADPAVFKTAIIDLIAAGRPVIAKAGAQFHVIIGYRGDKLICPDYKYAQNRPKKAPGFGELDELFIFGDKITPRFTLMDGLERSRRMLECNINEKIWDKYIEEIQEKIILPSDGKSTELELEEKKKVMGELKEAAWCAWSVWNFLCAFDKWQSAENPVLEGVSDEKREQFSHIFKEIWGRSCESMDLGHAITYLHKKIEWPNNPAPGGLGMMLVMTVNKYKELDAQLLVLINQAIETLK